MYLRDIIEVKLDLGGIPCTISDTAGLRSYSNDPIELEGMKRALQVFNEAQLKIFVSDVNESMEVYIYIILFLHIFIRLYIYIYIRLRLAFWKIL